MTSVNIAVSYTLLLFCRFIVLSNQDNFDDITGLAFNDDVYYDATKLGTEYIKGYGFAGPISFYTTNFTTMLRYSHMFIDKSLFIKAILETPGHLDILITCPRRWGKSINLLMLRRFLEIEVHPNGTVLQPRTKTANYKLFRRGVVSENAKLRHPLRISKHDHLFDDYQGQYPVIHLQPYMPDIQSEDHFYEVMKEKISEIYQEHKYMLKVFEHLNNTAADQDKSRAQKDYATFNSYLTRQSTRYDIKHSITFLSRVLAQHFSRKVYVLIDSYDDVVSYLYTENTCGNEEQMGDFYKEFLKYSLRDRTHISRFVLTGIANIELLQDRSVTRIIEHNLFNSTLGPFFGYNEREMDLIFNYTEIAQAQRILIKSWCNRYRYGSSALKIYHPLSVNIYLACKSFDYFYEPKLSLITKTIGLFVNIPKFEDLWCALLTGTRYTLDLYHPDFVYEHLMGIEKAIVEHTDPMYKFDSPQRNLQDPIDTALYFYLLNGYLTWGRRLPSTSSAVTRISVKIANKETSRRLKTFTCTHYAENCFGMTFGNMSQYTESVNNLFLTYLESGTERGTSFEAAYEYFLAIAPPLAVMDDRNLAAAANLTCHCFNVRQFIRASLLVMFSYRETFEIHCVGVLQNSTDAPDLFMTRANIGIVIRIHYDQQNHDFDLPVNTEYTNVFNRTDYFSHIDRVTYVALRVYPNKTVQVRGRTQQLR